ncbi:PEP-CTERM sorting domain-containing protein, partial [Thermogutta sp.]|uniref:PEP-CTERM sorting domain-containing protein n=1 Tax=Thermogutta sp. TaxID=1962930 RepID=UPI003C7DE213
LTAYAVAKITGFSGNTYTFGPFGPGADQLGYTWLADEVVAVYFDTNKNYTANSGSRTTDRQSATDGTLFATFGFGDAVDKDRGGATGTPFLKSTVMPDSPLLVITSGGLNVKAVGSAYSTIVFRPIGLPLQNYSSTLNSTIVVADPPNANWPLKSEDPFRIRPTPEPTSVIGLLGLGLGAGALGAIRRRKRA